MVRTAMILPVKAVIGLSASGLILAQLPAPIPGVDSFGRLSFDAALIAAVVALWRALAAKDARNAEKDVHIIAMTTKFTEVTVSVLDAVKELRGAVSALDIPAVKPNAEDDALDLKQQQEQNALALKQRQRRIRQS